MKKYLVCAAVGVLASAALLSACNEPTTAATETKHDAYYAYGTYYDGGVIVTDDGNEWEIDPENVKDGTPIVVVFDDAGTPNDIYDDEILEITER